VQTRAIDVAGIKIGGGFPLVLIAGPCVIEGMDACLRTAGLIKEAAAKAEMPLIFKASFDKANRTSANSYR